VSTQSPHASLRVVWASQPRMIGAPAQDTPAALCLRQRPPRSIDEKEFCLFEPAARSDRAGPDLWKSAVHLSLC
jgi:hypothetical protein